MKRIKILWQVAGLLVLQAVLSTQPVLGQNEPEAAPESTDHFHLFPPADQTAQKHSVANQFLRDIWTDQKGIWTSPFHINRKQALTIVLPLSAVTAGLIATDADTSRFLANTPGQVKWSQRFSNFGSVYTLGFVTAGPLIGGKIANKPRYTLIGRISAEALVNSIITNYALKEVTQRERPDHGDGNGHFWAGGQSFPSGHAMNSWAVAVAIARTHNCPRWLSITSYVMATGVSLSRWTAHKHFASDIVVGGVTGGLIGNYVATRAR
ncbi:MAG TPA: phosphatase PAP2 family protein [Acidobacteriota bacterium]|nr:phosphatase PAP2 family protein [Acidobacteriota bacterium]